MGFELDNLRFASDATFAGIGGIAVLALAAIALIADRRRVKRRHIDEVGWVPWTKLFFMAIFVGMALMMFAVKGWSGK